MAARAAIGADDVFGNATAAGRARVVMVQQPGATQAYQPQPAVVQQMVRTGMLRWTGKASLQAAWLAVVSPKDIVGIKVYSISGADSGTRPAVAEAVVQGLLEAGLPSSNIVIWDRRLVDLRLAGYTELARRYHIGLAGSSDAGYDENIRYTNSILGTLVAGDLEFDLHGTESGRYSHVSKLLTSNLTKIISIAPLLNHNVAGVCGHLYGLSMACADNSARFEASAARLAQAVPELYAMRAVGDKVALNITDGLICQYLGEQTSLLHYSTELNQIWISKDPVALDTLAIQELDRERQAKNIASRGDNPELYQNAALLELGVSDPSKLKLEVVQPAD
ncbi:MAG TPA: DUF362 domain-containing protein [Verrucomicrobiae bacterium]